MTRRTLLEAERRRSEERQAPGPAPEAPSAPSAPSAWRLPLALLFPIVVVLGALLLIEVLELNTRPGAYGAPTCTSALPDDDLVHLAQRDQAAARAQLARWDRCDEQADGATLRARARDALTGDTALIAWLAVALLGACVVASRYQRTHTAAIVGAALTGAYVVADVVENRLLRDLLDDAQYDRALPYAAAVKLGALGGAASLVIVVVALIAGGSNDPARPSSRRTVRAFVTGWWRRAADTTRRAPDLRASCLPPKPSDGGLGICCSGGGVRSAAFSLGALQSLDEAPSVVDEAQWLTAVSGGSYLATAWVTARDEEPTADPRPWARRSPEEDHLRRHASYLAPGLGGKLWALCRFLFGFAVNLLVVVVAFAVAGLPLGWLINTGADHDAVRGELSLPSGACVQLGGGGGYLVAVPDSTVRVTGGSPLHVGPGQATEPKVPTTSKGTVEVEGEGSGSIAVGGAPSSSTTTTAPPANACEPLPAGDPPSDELPAAAIGQTFPKGTKVPVLVAAPLEVSGRLAGCLRTQDDDPLVGHASCSPAAASVHTLPAHSRLLGAPRAVLTIDGRALVEASEGDRAPRLVRACGDEPCLSWDAAGWVWAIIAIPAGLAAVVGIGVVAVHRTDVARRRFERVLRWVTTTAAVAALAAWLVPALVLWLVHLRDWVEDRLGLASVSTGTLLAALLAQLAATSGKSDTPSGRAVGLAKKVGGKLRPVLVKAAAYVAGPLLLVGVALGFMVMGARDGLVPGQLALVLFLASFLVVIGLTGDLNEWSLHPFYREQLRQGFAVSQRSVSPPFDSLGAPREDPLQDINRAPGPALVICAAANIADDRLTAPGRPAVSWTFSKHDIGSTAILSATHSGFYAPQDLPPRFAHLASAWTAAAVSGAAFSPAMGKMSRPERVLFALGNLRLGVWYPNPRYRVDAEAAIREEGQPPLFDWAWYETHHPRPWYLVKEALGLHRVRDPWVYVTDGGHYENLGLVELLRRRCAEIYCFDASGDSPDTFGTLSEAMRIARSELEVEIDIRPTPMAPTKDDSGISRIGVWPGVVRYPDMDEAGWIILAKLTVPLTAPFDIIDLARTLPAFPAHPTGDQLYTDQKFEAYRALGAHLGAEARKVGGAIRILVEEDGFRVEDAVRAVQLQLCVPLDPPCPPPPGDDATSAPAETPSTPG